MADLADLLEREALGAGALPREHRLLASIAVSLKRIADALTGIGPNILNAPLNQYGEGIGECIEGQFNRSGQ